MDALLQLPRGKDAAETIQGLWHGHRVRQRVLRGGKPCCSALIADCLVRKLQPHQLLGVRWLYKAATRGGGILADDPGLGKTLQAIATIEALISSGWARRVFVVAPANLLANWQEEFRRWLGKTPAALNIVVAGAGEAGLCDKLKFSQLAAPMDDAGPRSHMLLLTSYESLASHGEPLRASIGVDLAVVDEAHRARNLGKQAVALIGVQARARLLLTATVLPNNLDELYNVVTIAAPGQLGTRADFREDFAAPIEAGRALGASAADVADAKDASDLLSEISGKVMLRRTNEELARGLPAKTTMLVVCRPTELQRALQSLEARGFPPPMWHRAALHRTPRTAAVGFRTISAAEAATIRRTPSGRRPTSSTRPRCSSTRSASPCGPARGVSCHNPYPLSGHTVRGTG